MTQKVPATTELLGWNINGGGYDRRHVFDTEDTDPDTATPEREAIIQAFINAQHMDGVNSAALIDAYGWRERYGSNASIAEHLGFKAARFALLQDDRINRVLGPGAGLAFATDHVVEQSGPIDLNNRQGLGTILNIDGRTLQVATVYLDDIDEHVRLGQLSALLTNLEQEPTIIVGDLNTLRPNMRGASINTRAHDLGLHALAFSFSLIPGKKVLEPILTAMGHSILAAKAEYYKRAVRGLNERFVIGALEANGWQDADPLKQPTFRKLGGLALSVDYAFSNKGIVTSDFRVIPSDGASDHDALRVGVGIA